MTDKETESCWCVNSVSYDRMQLGFFRHQSIVMFYQTQKECLYKARSKIYCAKCVLYQGIYRFLDYVKEYTLCRFIQLVYIHSTIYPILFKYNAI